MTSATAQARQMIAELDPDRPASRDRMAEVTRDLRDVQPSCSTSGRGWPARARPSTALEVRSPYAGKVVGLDVFGTAPSSQGAEDPRHRAGRSPLVVEARIAVEDIGELKPGMAAEVHFTAYKQRVIPMIHGTVAKVSADRLTDARTGAPYYTATVAVDGRTWPRARRSGSIPACPRRSWSPPSGGRRFDYLVGPLVASFDRSFREK